MPFYRRLLQLFLGLTTAGVGLALGVRAELGLGPWDVLHQGLGERLDKPIGTMVIAVGAVVLLGWIPLRQRPGVGTVLNVLTVGTVLNLTLSILPELGGLGVQIPAMLVGVGAVALGSGLYLGAGLGPGPRDGIMTGLAARGSSIRLVRTAIELSVLVLGWALGGTVGIGTVIFALAIGPLVQYFLFRFKVPDRKRGDSTVDRETPAAATPLSR